MSDQAQEQFHSRSSKADTTVNAKGNGALVFIIEALSVGGAEQMLVAMANQLSQRGWPCHMICLTERGELAANLSADVTVHVLNKAPGFDPRLAPRLRKLVRQLDPVAINSHLWTANTWTRVSLLLSGYRIVVTEHSRDTWKRLHHRIIDKLLSRFMYRMVAVSSDTADFYQNTVGVAGKKLTVINNGINTQRFRDASGSDFRKELVADDEVLVGTVGRMITAKNHPRLLQAVAALREEFPALRLVFVGDGPERANLEQVIEQTGMADITHLTGQRKDIPEILKAMDVFVLSSDREGHPLTALEAQAAGTPVVLTKAGGSADAIVRRVASVVSPNIAGEEIPDPAVVSSPGDSNAAMLQEKPMQGGALDAPQAAGMLVDKSADALTQALRCLLSDTALREAMGSLGAEQAPAQFDERVMIERYLGLFTADEGVVTAH